MNKFVRGVLSLSVLGCMIAGPVAAIDQDLSSPYSYNPETGEYTLNNPADGVPGGSGQVAGASTITLLGGGLLVLGVAGAVFWKLRDKKNKNSIQNNSG